MKKKCLLLIAVMVCVFLNKKLIAQTNHDSCGIRVSLLTCDAGDELYSCFGHSAFRVVDSSKQLDVVFNFGTFDFDDPNFYSKFTRGNLQYFVSVTTIQDFLAEYEYFKRSVIEQPLQLNCVEKTKAVAALFENARGENKYYRYDFAYDNCTSRLRDLIEKFSDQKLNSSKQAINSKTSFRQLIHKSLDEAAMPWSKLGIDILLGRPLDKSITGNEALFLPNNLLQAIDSSQLHNQPLTINKKTVLHFEKRPTQKKIFTPLLVFAILFGIIALLSLLFRTKRTIFFRAFDFVFFLSTGLIGVLLLFMWFGTSHTMCKENFNLLWALPTNLIACLFLFSNKQWLKNYFLLQCFYGLTLFATWFLLPQQLNNALLFINGITVLRSYFIGKME